MVLTPLINLGDLPALREFSGWKDQKNRLSYDPIHFLFSADLPGQADLSCVQMKKQKHKSEDNMSLLRSTADIGAVDGSYVRSRSNFRNLLLLCQLYE